MVFQIRICKRFIKRLLLCVSGELKFVVVNKTAKVKTLLEEGKQGNILLDTIITMEEPNEEVKTMAEETGTKLKTFQEVLEAGKSDLKDFVVSIMREFILL